MINITLLSDYGNASHYSASIKGNLYKNIANIQVIDISHNVEKYNNFQASFILRNVIDNFKEGSIHLICVNTNVFLNSKIIIAYYKNQYFIALDNGLLNLFFENENAEIWELKEEYLKENKSLFVENNQFIFIANQLVNNNAIEKFAIKSTLTKQNVINNFEFDENGITATVMYIDGFGNAITNISKEIFLQYSVNKKFKIYYARKEFFTKISNHYKEVQIGGELILFNSSNFLEIATNEGNASQLLGLRVGSKILIEFIKK